MSTNKEERKKTSKPMVVILVGASGSDNTTFCSDVIAAGRHPWVRVYQDIIANGKPSTKLQCLKVAADALNDGKSVFIDRCNLDREQRAEFVNLGGSKADFHAVVLDLPAWFCIKANIVAVDKSSTGQVHKRWKDKKRRRSSLLVLYFSVSEEDRT